MNGLFVLRLEKYRYFGGFMETKQYSDIWQLMVAPFKRGIPQIVEHGSCRKGFYATAALAFLLLRV